jgi:hypothetical protein
MDQYLGVLPVLFRLCPIIREELLERNESSSRI